MLRSERSVSPPCPIDTLRVDRISFAVRSLAVCDWYNAAMVSGIKIATRRFEKKTTYLRHAVSDDKIEQFSRLFPHLDEC